MPTHFAEGYGEIWFENKSGQKCKLNLHGLTDVQLHECINESSSPYIIDLCPKEIQFSCNLLSADITLFEDSISIHEHQRIDEFSADEINQLINESC